MHIEKKKINTSQKDKEYILQCNILEKKRQLPMLKTLKEFEVRIEDPTWTP